MGYTTTFRGRLRTSRLLSDTEVGRINSFCEKRHGGNMRPFRNMPGFWCNWEADNESIFWNGAEKSYAMDEWLEVLIEKFFDPWKVSLSGKMLAQGEQMNDTWTLEVLPGNKVVRTNINIPVNLGITE
jgi:hypothetical protein